jgi:hypothetical protein
VKGTKTSDGGPDQVFLRVTRPASPPRSRWGIRTVHRARHLFREHCQERTWPWFSVRCSAWPSRCGCRAVLGSSQRAAGFPRDVDIVAARQGWGWGGRSSLPTCLSPPEVGPTDFARSCPLALPGELPPVGVRRQVQSSGSRSTPKLTLTISLAFSLARSMSPSVSSLATRMSMV